MSIVKKILDKHKIDPELRKDLEKELETFLNYQEDYSRMLNTTVESISLEIEEYKQKLLENQNLIVKKSKMATIGEVTATLSHEINNQLMIISGNTQLIEMINMNLKNDTIKIAVENSLKTLNNMSALIKNIKKFSYHTKDKVDYILDSPQGLVDQTLNVCDHFLSKSRVKVLLDGKIDENFECYLASSELGQVLLNLIKNAFDHANDQKNDEEKWISISSHLLNESKKMRFIISNGGKILSPEIKEKLFSPFFTTKEIGKGTGIGLSLCQKIIESLGGKIYYDDSNSKISFIVEIPLILAVEIED